MLNSLPLLHARLTPRAPKRTTGLTRASDLIGSALFNPFIIRGSPLSAEARIEASIEQLRGATR
jgi:hypothetical protein